MRTDSLGVVAADLWGRKAVNMVTEYHGGALEPTSARAHVQWTCKKWLGAELMRFFRFLGLVLLLTPAGCAWLSPTPDPLVADGVRISDQHLTLPDGSVLAYRGYQPTAVCADRTWIILAHGFLRDQTQMRDLALALAQAGFQVATLNARHDSVFNGAHVKHGRDMIHLADHLQARERLYAGFSAGGLAALLAARTDPRAIGVLTLDLVDSQMLGQHAAEGLPVPLIALTGAPGNCNANQNAAPIYQRVSQVHLRTFPTASHCDFESPSDWFCEWICEQPVSSDSGDSRTAIIQHSVAEIEQLLSGDSRR